MDQGTRDRLVLISTPASFGKTTVLSEWMATDPGDADVRVAWLSLDPAGSDLTRFLTYLVAAVGTVVPHIGEELAAGLRSPRPPAMEVVVLAVWLIAKGFTLSPASSAPAAHPPQPSTTDLVVGTRA